MNAAHTVKNVIMQRSNMYFAQLLRNTMFFIPILCSNTNRHAFKRMAMLVAFLVLFVEGAEAQDHTIANGRNEIVSNNTTWNSLTIADGNNSSSLTIRSGATLTINSNLTINAPSQNNKPKYIVVEPGAKLIVKGNISMANSRAASRDCYIEIKDNAEVTVGGNITMNGNADRNFFYFSGNGTLNVGGTMSGGCITKNEGGSAANPGTGTVNFTGTGVQTIPTYTYYNLTTSGGGTYTLAGATTVNGTLKLERGNLNTGGNNLTIGNSVCGNGLINSTSTVTYNESCSSLIAGSYKNLTLNGSTEMSACGNVTVSGTTSIGAGKRISTEFDITFNTISGGGVDATTINATAGTIYYKNAASKILSGTYNNLDFVGGNSEIAGSVTVNGTFTWPSGRIKLYSGTNNYSFTLGPNATISSASAYGEAHMFVFAKSSTEGFVTYQGDATKINTTIPVGNINGTSYTYRPLTISNANVDGQGYVSVRSTNNRSGKGNATDLQCYWTTESDKVAEARLKFDFVATDDTGNELFPYRSSNGFEWSKWSVAGSAFNRDNKTITFENCTPSGQWSACEDVKTFYSFTSGYWNMAESWTFDPAGQDRNGANIPTSAPGESDRVVILNGNTITINANGTKCLSLQIYSGGTLDLGSTTQHNFGTVTGQGLMRIKSSTFPGGNYASNFVAENGGTIEYYGNANITLPDRTTYNNLIINLTGTTATLTRNITVNGDFTVQNGTFMINSNTATQALTMVVKQNITVNAGAAIRTGTGQVAATQTIKHTNGADAITNVPVAHRLEVYGNFTNNGTAYFTNLTAPDYLNWRKDRVDVAFVDGTKDQNVVLNGETRFYRIEINKGIDQTYILNVDASNTNNFKLFGYNTGMKSDYTNYTNGVNNYYALGLMKGTLRLGANIILPSMVEERDASSDFNYVIDANACLWVDGATVTTTQRENGGYANSLVIYGKLKVTNSNSKVYLTNQHGFIMRWSGAVELQDGYIETPIFRTSVADGTHRGSLTISGGTMKVTGNDAVQNSHPTFSMTYSGMSFNMSGGTLEVHRGTSGNAQGSGRAIVIGADPSNCNITGGTVKVFAENWWGQSYNANINSTAPFWDLVIEGTSGTEGTQIVRYEQGYGSEAVDIQPLVVLNNLTLQNGGRLNANNQNVYVGGNFIINNGCTYTPGNNTTIFNGNGNVQLFSNNGTINNNLNNLTVANGAYLRLQSNIVVRNQLSIEQNATLADNAKTLTVSGNVENNGVHYNSNSTAGSIILNGGNVQTISGNGSFNNLHINKSGGSVALASNVEVTGCLRLLSNTILNIGSYNLNLNDADADIYSNESAGKAFSNRKMITTDGNQSDGGITKMFSNTNKFVFPYGFGNYYLPAEIQFDVEPTAYGSVTSRPVNSLHYVLNNTDNALKCYWSNSSAGFEGVTSVNHYYYYNSNDFVNNATAESSYIPAYYYVDQWVPNTNTSLVDENNNNFRWESCPVINGDFTAGSVSVMTRAPEKLYSSSTPGDWSDANSWSSVEVGGAGGAGTPGARTVVFIGDQTHNHTITISRGNVNCGSLNIANGSMLDLGTTQGHNFGFLPDGAVGGNGTLRISSNNYFPNGDFGTFLRAGGGTVEYYASANNITPSASVTTYNNLILSATNNRSTTLPNVDITVYGNLTSQNNGTATNKFNNQISTRTVTIKGDLNVATGTLEYNNANSAQNVVVEGNVNVSAGANLRNGNSRRHNFTLYGNMVCNGAIAFNTGGGVVTTFTGTRNDTIKGTGTISLYNLICDKGTDTTAVLSLQKNIAVTQVDGAFLDLRNGTFQIDADDVDLNITENANFEVKSSACLWVNRGKVNVCNSTATNLTLNLNGTIKVYGGELTVGTATGATDIEYSSGHPTIDIRGGVLNVLGQIRRSYAVALGDLTYKQSGGEVKIFGNKRDNGQTNHRALFEVCNNGNFNISGGQITILGGGLNDASIADIELSCATSSATGGTIAIGSNDAECASDQTYYMNAGTEIFNVTVGTESKAQTLQFVTSAIDMNGSLTINRNSKVYVNSNNLNIAGDFVTYNANGYYYTSTGNQTTTFDGTGLQKIIGIGASSTTVPKLKFNKLTFDNPSKVQLDNVAITAENTLTINRGTVDDAGNKIVAKSNVVNDGKHISSAAGGYLAFEGSGSTQFVSSSASMLSSGNSVASFGNVRIGNYTEMTNAIEITGELTLSENLYANDYQLYLTKTATINDASVAMIVLNGAIGDAGVIKYFDNGFTGSFKFCIGIADNYTPVTYTFSSLTSNNGYVNIKPINYRHTSISPATEPINCLNYYWMVTTSGLDNISANIDFTYTDNLLTDGGSESLMIGQRFAESQWHHYPDETSIDADANTFTISGIDNLNGDFTCGFPAYSQLPTYYSKTSGNWNDKNSWQYVDAGGNWQSAQYAPSGNPVIIQNGHTITMDGSSPNCAYSVTIDEGGKLDVGTTVGHNLGIVRGGGTLSVGEIDNGSGMYSFKVPAGEYAEFYNNASSTIEFYGEHTATLPAKPGNYYNPFQNVVFKGNGTKNITTAQFYAKGNVTIENGCHIDNSVSNRDFYVGGNFTDLNTTNSGYICGTSIVRFVGTNLQLIDVRTDAQFYNLQINNPAGVDVTNNGTSNNNLIVANTLYLTNGVLYTASNSLISISNTSASAVNGGSATSFVDGPLRKNISNSGTFKFPVGNGSRLGYITLSNVNNNGASAKYWTAEYKNEDPTNVCANIDATLTEISDNEYWIVKRPDAASNAKVGLRWDSQSCPMFTNLTLLKQRLNVVEFDGASIWNVCQATASGSLTSGTITTNNAVTADNYYFTFGFSGVIAEITTVATQTICNDGTQTANIDVALYGTAPFTLKYKIGSSEFTQSNINASTYTITRNSAQLGGVAGTYNIELVSVKDASTDGVVKLAAGTIDVLAAYEPVFVDASDVAGFNDVRTYVVENHAGSTYSWSWVGTAPQTTTPNNNSVTVKYPTTGSADGTLYVLKVTETASTGCAISVTHEITMFANPQPSFTAEVNICQTDVIAYQTSQVAGHTYKWYVDGAQVGTSSSVTINWSNYAAGSHTINVVESDSRLSGNKEKTVYVYASPVSQTIADIDAVCEGNQGVVTITGSEQNTTYKLFNQDDVNVGNTLSGTGAAIDFTTVKMTSYGNVNLYITASNQGCEMRIPASGYKTLTVKESPNVTITWPDLYLGAPTDVPFTVNSAVMPTHYSINYTDGGTNVASTALGNIVMTATGSNVEGYVTITANNGCSTDYQFAQTMLEGYVWSGAIDNDWSKTGNWFSNAVPSRTTDAIIRDVTNQPTIKSAAEVKSVKIESGGLTIENNNQLDVYGDWKCNDAATFTSNASTVSFNGASNVESDASFFNLAVASGASLSLGANALTVNGNIENNGTINGETSTLTLQGSAAITLSGSGDFNLNNLTIDNANGASLQTNLNINGALALVSGEVETNGNLITLNATATATSAAVNAYVNGQIRKNNIAAGTEFVFPIGNNGHRGMIGVNPVSVGSFTVGYSFNDDPDGEEIENKAESLLAVSQIDNWDVVCNSSPSVSSYISLYWDDNATSQINDASAMVVAHYNSSTSSWDDMGGSASSNGSGGKVTCTVPFSSYSPVALASSSLVNPLPITLVNFDAKQNGNAVEVSWTTLSELNNNRFEIERSTDGENFTLIGVVNGANTSNNRINYSFTDNNPEFGYQYYRLRQVDFDGQSTYAGKTICVKFVAQNDEPHLTIEPNPTNGKFTIEVNQSLADGNYAIFAQTGQVVKLGSVVGSTSVIDISNLPRGLYILQYTSSNVVMNQKIVKL